MRERLEAAIQEIEPDVIHAHFGPQGVRIAPVARSLGIPLVVTFYGSDLSAKTENEFWVEKYRELWPQADAVTVLSDEMKGRAEELGCPSSKLRVVHLCRDLEEFSFRPPNDPVQNILFVGRLVPKKAPLDAVRAVQLANERGADLHLDIIGEGPLRESVSEYVEKEGLNEVALHGRIPSTEVVDHMQAADAFILPSKVAPNGDREGTPTVLVEAQAVGLPCVTTQHAGIPEMIPDQNQDLLCSEGNIEAMSEALVNLSDASVDTIVCRAEHGRQKVEEEFDLSTEVQKLRELYREVSEK
jgi:glycosyltransferase involved in cell wall biosynthesis